MRGVVERVATTSGLGPGTTAILLAVGALLLVTTAKRALWLGRFGADEDDRRRWRSVTTWWVLFLVMTTALVLGRWAVVLTMAVLSLLLLREALGLTEAKQLYPFAAVGALGLYAWAWLDGRTVFLTALPLVVAVWVVIEAAARIRGAGRSGAPRAALRAFLLSVVGPSFVVGVASLPAPEALPATEMGWLVLLAVLTELNDAAQAWWGRNFGSKHMAPRISPRKTWVGLAGGVATTVAAALLLAPMVTSYGRPAPPGAGSWGGTLGVPWAWSLLLGMLVGLAGTAGDLAASILKRQAGVKDSGTLLPGHGGLLDRFDSLSVAAPVYFYVTWLLWHAQG